MARILSFTSFFIPGIYEDQGYLDDEMGVMHNSQKGLALFCGHTGEDTVAVKVFDKNEVEEIITSLKGVKSDRWEQMMKDSGYETLPGEDYFK